MVSAARLCPPENNVMGFTAAVFTLSGSLVANCWWKGEALRPRLR
jgi:hypothetical protein